MPENPSNYFHTVLHLKPKQIIYRLYYAVKKRNKYKSITFLRRNSYRPAITGSIIPCAAYSDRNTFSFLNISHQFHDRIDWNYTGHGMLWAYNLNYFEFLHQNGLGKETGLRLMRDYVDQYKSIRIGYDSYPVSLRNIFWIRFLSKYTVCDGRLDAFLHDTYKILLHNLEYHLSGNHLLENAFSLLFGAYYFHDLKMYRKAYGLLRAELAEQILADGGHFELSPMYHQIVLYRMLDCINLMSGSKWMEDDLQGIMRQKASAMLSWMKNMMLSSGNVPFFNDTSGHIAPSSAELLEYAGRLQIPCPALSFSDSGYRRFRNERCICICDVGGIAPACQPGHAHADTFTFVLEVDGRPFIVDTGCSTYEKNSVRFFERGTAAHNTVVVNGRNSSGVWSSHRVGRRARVTVLEDTPQKIKAQHDGFSPRMHVRTFSRENNRIEIVDEVRGTDEPSKNTAYFHLDSSAESIAIKETAVSVSKIKLVFEGSSKIYVEDYGQAAGFNKTVKARCICVNFAKTLRTAIIFEA